jgi:hypothetical protein
MIDNLVRFDSWHAYGRGLNALDGDTEIRGNLIDGQTIRTQLGGSVKVIGNVWSSMRSSRRDSTRSQWVACESYMFDSSASSIGNERYLRIHPVNVLIANNTIYSPKSQAMGFNFYSTNSVGEGDNAYPAGAVTVKNNIIYRPVGKFVSTYEDSGKVIGQQVISHNCVHNGIVGDIKVSWRGSDYTINAAPGCSSNLETDPVLDAARRPSGVAVVSGGAPVAGRDYYGKTLRSAPNIGAVDSTDPARQVTNRTVTTRSIAAPRIKARAARISA